MDSYVKAITLDVNADQNYTIVKAKQGDKINRKIAITLKKDGTNFTPTGVSEIWFRVEKPDKNIAIVKSTDSGNPISVSGNVYTVSLSEQCLTASGKAWCDLALLDSSGNTLSSCAFIMNIIPMPNGNTAESISEWTDLQKAIDDAERFADIVAFRTSGNYIQYTVDGQTWTNLVNVGAIGGDLQTQIDAVKDSVAQTYNTDTTYNVGDYAYRPSDRKLYRCIQNTSGAWNNAAWTEVSVSDELENVKGSLNAITPFDSTPTIGSSKGVTSDGIKSALDNVNAYSNTDYIIENSDNVSNSSIYLKAVGNIILCSGYITLNGTVAGYNAILGTFPTVKPTSFRKIFGYCAYNGEKNFYPFGLNSDGSLTSNIGSGTISGQITFPDNMTFK